MYFHASLLIFFDVLQTPLEKAHVVRAEKKKRREEIKAKRLAVLKEAREKKARAKKA